MLLDPRLAESAKLVWMFCQLEAQVPAPRVLERRSGLSRHTVLRGLAQLQAPGWLPAPTGCTEGAATGVTDVPGDLLFDPRPGFRAKVLYAYLQLTPDRHGPDGRFTYTDLGRLTGANRKSLKRAVGDLQATGWLRAEQWGKFSRVRFTLRNPVLEWQQGKVLAVSRRLEAAPCLGEELMREYLNLIVDTDMYIDYSRLAFLVNPYTDDRLEFGRYYLVPRVVFEYNGPPDDGPTALGPEDARTRQGCHYLKAGICASRGIHFVVVHAADLSLAAMQQKVPDLLPRRDLDGDAPHRVPGNDERTLPATGRVLLKRRACQGHPAVCHQVQVVGAGFPHAEELPDGDAGLAPVLVAEGGQGSGLRANRPGAAGAPVAGLRARRARGGAGGAFAPDGAGAGPPHPTQRGGPNLPGLLRTLAVRSTALHIFAKYGLSLFPLNH